MKKAKVFISCGQLPEEKEVGLKVQKYVEDKGFSAYFAERVNSSQALTEHIFNALKDSEYFVSINVEREKSEIGSLFVQQELAIASFLKLDIIPFHKGKVNTLQGVSKFLILKSNSFTKIEEIFKKLDELTKGWDNNSKNQLELSFDNRHLNLPQRNDNWEIVRMDEKPVIDDWYHVTVHNLSSSINVRNCFGYIESIKNLNDGSIIFSDNYKIELMWAGIGLIGVNIPTKGKRDLDAFFYRHNVNLIFFNQISTSSFYRYPILHEGEYEIVYVVIADNIGLAKMKVSFTFENKKIIILSANQI